MSVKLRRLTRGQAAVISAYTGILAGDFATMHGYVETLLGRPVLTHEMGDKATWKEIKAAARADFEAICFKESK